MIAAIFVYILYASSPIWALFAIAFILSRKYKLANCCWPDFSPTLLASLIIGLVCAGIMTKFDWMVLAWLSGAAYVGLYLFMDRRYRLMKEFRDGELSLELSHMQALAAADPGNGALHERLSQIYEKMGRYDDAVSAYRKVCEADPSVRNSYQLDILSEKARAAIPSKR